MLPCVRAGLAGAVIALITGCGTPSQVVPIQDQLQSASELAAERIRASQAPDGHWPMPATLGPDFVNAEEQTSPYVQALVLQVLGPASGAYGLQRQVDAAQHFLQGQIEVTGLVRFHGLPSQSEQERGLCPDIDDTSLVWLSAPPPDKGLLVSVLDRFDERRLASGLYETWLRSGRGAACNLPARHLPRVDSGVQVHLLLFFEEYAPEQLPPLCEAVRESWDDPEFWRYYPQAPVVIALREPDLARAGCELRFPEGLLDSVPSGQAPWLEAVTQLNMLRSAESAKLEAQPVIAILLQLAEAEFAAVQEAPPLIFHDDPKADRQYFWWSPDLGYAIWLRLLHEATAAGLLD